MKFGSVCSGIEAASVAWHKLGWEPAWLSEVDVAASTVLAYRLGATAPRNPMPGTEKSIAKIRWGDSIVNWGDMTRLPEFVRSGEATAPDVFCGGTPCQDFSVAGLRAGLDGDRGNLTLTFVEIANEIDLKRAADGDEPCIIFWENVPGVLSDKTNAFGCFLAGLAGEDVPLEPSGKRWADAGAVIGPQRTVAWRKLDAQYFGLAQRRERVFVVASAREGFDPVEVLLEFDGLRRDSAPSREAWEEITHSIAPSLTDSGRGVERAGESRGQDPVVACERPGHATGLAPQWWDGSPVSQTLDAVLHKGQTMPEKNRFPAVLQPIPILEAGARTGKSTTDPRAGIGIGNQGDPMYTLQGGKQHGVFAPIPFDTTQITSPSNYSNPKPGSPCHPLAAGAHVPAIAFHPTQDPISSVERTHALNTANNGKGSSEDGTGRGVPTVALLSEMAVRRLMPMECERLQGFFDFWTTVPTTLVSKANQKKARAAMEAGDPSFVDIDGEIRNVSSDGSRYKQLGNSWPVPVIEWIGTRIDAQVRALEGQTVSAVADGRLLTWLTAA